jgi:hypothetical protein
MGLYMHHALVHRQQQRCNSATVRDNQTERDNQMSKNTKTETAKTETPVTDAWLYYGSLTAWAHGTKKMPNVGATAAPSITTLENGKVKYGNTALAFWHGPLHLVGACTARAAQLAVFAWAKSAGFAFGQVATTENAYNGGIGNSAKKDKEGAPVLPALSGWYGAEAAAAYAVLMHPASGLTDTARAALTATVATHLPALLATEGKKAA